MSKLATAMVVLSALVGIAVGVALSSLTEVLCGPFNRGNCVEVHRFSTAANAGIGLLAAVAVGVGVSVLSRLRT